MHIAGIKCGRKEGEKKKPRPQRKVNEETVHGASWRWRASPRWGLFPYTVLICLFDRLSGQPAGRLPEPLNNFLNGTPL